MNDNLFLLLKNALLDEKAEAELFNYLKQAIISAEDWQQLHVYIKQVALENSVAIYLHAMLYEHGFGVKQDEIMAFLFFREAAAKGHAKATYEIGKHYLEGRGVEQNISLALEWLELAAGSPHYVSQAMFSLGVLNEEGLVIAKNKHIAKTWYAKAAQKGHEEAKKRLDHMNLAN